MTLIRLTSKRQATLPRQLCEDMQVREGDALVVDTILVDGERVWLLKPANRGVPTWFGRLKRYAKGKKHDMESVRASIEKSRRAGGD